MDAKTETKTRRSGYIPKPRSEQEIRVLAVRGLLAVGENMRRLDAEAAMRQAAAQAEGKATQ